MGFRLGPFKMGVVNKSETSLLSCVTVRSMMDSCNSENRTMVLEFRVFYLFTYAKEMHDDGNNASLFFTPRNIEGQHVFFHSHMHNSICQTVFCVHAEFIRKLSSPTKDRPLPSLVNAMSVKLC